MTVHSGVVGAAIKSEKQTRCDQNSLGERIFDSSFKLNYLLCDTRRQEGWAGANEDCHEL